MTAIYDFLRQPATRPAVEPVPVPVPSLESLFDTGEVIAPRPTVVASGHLRSAGGEQPRSPGPRPRVAVVVDRLSSRHARVVQGLEAGLRRQGVALMVYVAGRPAHRDDEVLAELLGGARLSGLVSLTYPLTGRHGLLGPLAELPLVVVGAHAPHVATVACDNSASMSRLMTHLLDEGKVRHPAFVRGLAVPDSNERELGFRAACAERGIAVVATRLLDGGTDRASAYRATSVMLGTDADVDAIVVADDEMAEGVLDALADHSRDVPGAVKVAGFDGDARSARARPPLTTVDQRLYEQGEAAADLLVAQLNGDRQPRAVRIEGRLIVRRSTRPYAAAPGRRTPPGLVVNDRESMFHVVQAEIGPCPPVIDGSWARRWLEHLHDQMLSGVLDEGWVGSWGRPSGSVDDLERATTWLIGASRVVMDIVWRRFRDDGSFPAADIHGQVVARLAAVRADGTRASDRGDLVGLRHVAAMNHALSAVGSVPELVAEVVSFLPQLGVSTCFLVLFDPPDDQAAEQAAAGQGAGGHTAAGHAGTEHAAGDPVAGGAGGPQARVVLAYADGRAQPVDDPGFALEHLLGGADGDGPPMTVQPLVDRQRQYGLLLYRQDAAVGHGADAVQRDLVSRIEEVVTRQRTALDADGLRRRLEGTTAELAAEVEQRRKLEDELRRVNRELARSLLVDPLTGIGNRASLDEVLEREFTAHGHSRRPLAVVMIDIDRFKSYNDRHGHQQGDETLRTVAVRLRESARRGGDVAARYGGEEFALVLPDTDVRGGERVARQVLEDVRAAAIVHEDSPSGLLSVSLGVAAVVPGEGWDASDLLRAADTALYEAKAAGRDTVGVSGPLLHREPDQPGTVVVRRTGRRATPAPR